MYNKITTQRTQNTGSSKSGTTILIHACPLFILPLRPSPASVWFSAIFTADRVVGHGRCTWWALIYCLGRSEPLFYPLLLLHATVLKPNLHLKWGEIKFRLVTPSSEWMSNWSKSWSNWDLERICCLNKFWININDFNWWYNITEIYNNT